MRPRVAFAAVATAATIILVGCGETIDLADDQPGTTVADSTVAPLDEPVLTDGDVADLLPAMLDSWQGLSERVIERDRDDEALDRIRAVWRAAEPQLRVERPELLFGFEQAVDLAISSVERRRPADADKGYRLAVDLVGDYLGRQASE